MRTRTASPPSHSRRHSRRHSQTSPGIIGSEDNHDNHETGYERESNSESDECIIDAQSVWFHPFGASDVDCNSNSNSNIHSNSHQQCACATAFTVDASAQASAPAPAPNQDTERNTTTAAYNASVRRHGWIGIGLVLALTAIAAVGIGVWQHNLGSKSHSNRTHNNSNTNNSNKNDDHENRPLSSLFPTATPPPTPLSTKAAPPFPWNSLGDYHESLLQTVLARVESFNANSNANANGSNTTTNNNKNLLDAYSWTTRGTPQFEALRFVAYQDGGVNGGGDMGYYYGRTNTDTHIANNHNAIVVEDDTPLLLQRLALLVLFFQTGGGFSWAAMSSTSTSTSTSDSSQTGSRKSRKRYLQEGTAHRDNRDKNNDNTYGEHSDMDSTNSASENWATPGVDECLWDGVVCDKENYQLTKLLLKERGLGGMVPIEAWVWLPHLTIIDVSENQLTGELPFDLFWPLSNPKTSSQSMVHLSSSSSKQAHLSHLNILDLSFNQFEGSLPETLEGGLLSLQVLNLSHNRLTGRLPTNYDRQTLEQLHLSSNKITGSLPFDDWFKTSHSNSLLFLDLADNLLSGTIPTSLGNHLSLQFLSLQNNPLLSGNLPPASLVQKLSSLKTLYLSDCGLGGSLTNPLIGLLRLPQLERLSMSDNKLTGSLPSLEQVQNSNESNISPSVLKALNLGNNEITGTIPPDLFGQKLTNLEHFQLFRNDIEGSIPYSRFYPNTLSVLWLQNNPKLVGTMPCSSTSAISSFVSSHDDDLDSNVHGGDVLRDYRADCWAPALVECPCCKRCF